MVYPYKEKFSNKKKCPSPKCDSASLKFMLTSINLRHVIAPQTKKQSGRRENRPMIKSEFTFVLAAQLCYLNIANTEL